MTDVVPQGSDPLSQARALPRPGKPLKSNTLIQSNHPRDQHTGNLPAIKRFQTTLIDLDGFMQLQ
jgi:hypothetical protein